MHVPQRGRAVASLRGNAVACLLWMLLLWRGDGCQAQRAGGATEQYAGAGPRAASVCVHVCEHVCAGVRR